jgi:hypothetical protein
MTTLFTVLDAVFGYQERMSRRLADVKKEVERLCGWHFHTWLYYFDYEGFPIRKKCLTCGRRVGRGGER